MLAYHTNAYRKKQQPSAEAKFTGFSLFYVIVSQSGFPAFQLSLNHPVRLLCIIIVKIVESVWNSMCVNSLSI